MDKVQKLNNEIFQELEMDRNDGGNKLTDILITAESLYKELTNAALRDIEAGNAVDIPEEVQVLGENITRIKRRLLVYSMGSAERGKGR